MLKKSIKAMALFLASICASLLCVACMDMEVLQHTTPAMIAYAEEQPVAVPEPTSVPEPTTISTPLPDYTYYKCTLHQKAH